MKKRLGRLEQQLFAFVQLRELRTLRTGDLSGPLQITTKQESELLSRLSRAGMIAQVRRGLYLVPERLPLGEPLSGEAVRSWSGDTWTLVPAAAAIPVTFLGDPTPVAGRVVELTGSGGNQQRDGWPAEAKGALTFTLELDALTQPVRQSHRIAWTLTDVTVRR